MRYRHILQNQAREAQAQPVEPRNPPPPSAPWSHNGPSEIRQSSQQREQQPPAWSDQQSRRMEHSVRNSHHHHSSNLPTMPEPVQNSTSSYSNGFREQRDPREPSWSMNSSSDRGEGDSQRGGGGGAMSHLPNLYSHRDSNNAPVQQQQQHHQQHHQPRISPVDSSNGSSNSDSHSPWSTLNKPSNSFRVPTSSTSSAPGGGGGGGMGRSQLDRNPSLPYSESDSAFRRFPPSSSLVQPPTSRLSQIWDDTRETPQSGWGASATSNSSSNSSRLTRNDDSFLSNIW